MSLALFHKVPAGAIETLFDEQKQPLFKRADLGKYLGIVKIRGNFKEFPSHYTRSRSDIPKAVALVKWLTKKGVEKIQEEHQTL